MQSLILNNQHNLKISNNYFRFIQWKEHKWSPETLNEIYFEQIANCQDLFARKFEIPTSNIIIKMIDDLIYK